MCIRDSFLTSGFVYESAEMAEAVFANQIPHYQYSRFSNPTVVMLEQKLAAIEGADVCRCTATGMAAVSSAMLAGLKAGDRVVAARALFGSCHWIVSCLLYTSFAVNFIELYRFGIARHGLS